MDVNNLWGDRVREFWNEAIRYLRLLGNSGFMFSLYALFIAGGYFYPSFIEWLPEAIPVSFILAGVFTYMLTKCPLRTFLKEGDLVFLLPLEPKLKNYFRNSVLYSFIMQSIAMAIIFLLLGPLFQDRVNEDSGYLYSVLFCILVANLWNYASFWAEARIQTETIRNVHVVARVVINAGLTTLLFHNAAFWYPAAVFLIMLFVYLFYYYPLLTQHLLKWELLLALEQKRLSIFYRFVQSFTDVPHVKAGVKRRKWITSLTDSFIWKNNSVYKVLFGKAFIRSGEYLGMYTRLLVTGGLVMYAFPNDWFRLGVALLFVYMTSVQLRTLWHHLDVMMWPDLYPVSISNKQLAFRHIAKRLLLFQTVLLSIVYGIVGSAVLPGTLVLVIGLLFCYFYPIFKKDRGVT
ncbi:ABC-2 type transport system permease protein [Salibacterium salarium]|uniref:ABC transporter permease n=1 Tax=Salibacterium salarium TaxID=284579 RepID=UPI002781E9DB|nr:ABC transporter permease [Salibacterium salarium]MDQ0299864.1 ABC-2 type transport system permease protein [Salibacterium salarium]